VELTYVTGSSGDPASLGRTLDRLPSVTPLDAADWEVWVVDAGDDPRRLDEVRRRHNGVRITREPLTPAALLRVAGHRAAGKAVVTLPPGARPLGDTIDRSLAYLDAHPAAAAVGGRVVRDAGRIAGPALPTLLRPGAACLRREALTAIDLPTAADITPAVIMTELSLRLWHWGWRIDHFDDLFYRQEGPCPRGWPTVSELCGLGRRWLPAGLREALLEDWQHPAPPVDERTPVPGDAAGPLDAETADSVFGGAAITETVADWTADAQLRRVAIADWCPWTHFSVAGARAAGAEVRAVIDLSDAGRAGPYRGIEVVGLDRVLSLGVDAVIVATRAPARVAAVTARVREVFDGPVFAVTATRGMVRATEESAVFTLGSADDTAIAALPAA